MGWGVWGKEKWGKEEEELSDWRRRRRRRRRKKQDVGRYPMGPTKMELLEVQFNGKFSGKKLLFA